MLAESDIRRALNRVIDPCSTAAGCAAGLDDMGLLRAVTLQHGPAGCRVEVVIGVTEYGCFMGAPFATEAYKILSVLPGVVDVEVRLDDRFDWVPEDMAADYRARLHAHRAKRGILTPRPCSERA